MKNIILINKIVILCFLVASCSNDEKFSQEDDKDFVGVSFSNDSQEEVFLKELEKNNIEYKKNISYISWEPKYSASVANIHQRIFGRFPPEGTSVSYSGERQKYFKNLLIKNGINYETIFYKQQEYIVWKQKDSEEVDKLKSIVESIQNSKKEE